MQDAPAPHDSRMDRRTIVKGGAWSMPVIVAAVAVPMAVASGQDDCSESGSKSCSGIGWCYHADSGRIAEVQMRVGASSSTGLWVRTDSDDGQGGDPYSVYAAEWSFTWPWAVNWDRSRLPAGWELVSSSAPGSAVTYTLRLIDATRFTVSLPWGTGGLRYGDARAAIPGFLVRGVPSAVQSSRGGIRVPVGRRYTYGVSGFPAACAGSVENPMTGGGAGTVSLGSRPGALRSAPREAAENDAVVERDDGIVEESVDSLG